MALSGEPSFIVEPRSWDVDQLAYGPLALSAETLSVSMAGAATQVTLAAALTELQSILATLNASLAVTGTFYQATQPVSAASLPLPTGAATQATLAALETNTAKIAMTPVSGSVSGTGNNAVLTPSSGKKLRLHYASYNPSLAVEAGFRFGAAGPLFLRNSVGAGAVIAKDFGDMRYLEGAVDESLFLNMVVGVACIWNAIYTEA